MRPQVTNEAAVPLSSFPHHVAVPITERADPVRLREGGFRGLLYPPHAMSEDRATLYRSASTARRIISST